MRNNYQKGINNRNNRLTQKNVREINRKTNNNKNTRSKSSHMRSK